ncbi:MAG: hypothetical protein K6L75_00040 [Cellvibrionaceae bacterium]
MSSAETENSQSLPNTDQVWDAEQLRKIVSEICQSGELGRSKVYAKLLTYLAEASINNKTPKEIEIAVDVLERDETFDVTKDSAVRVYVHQLRKRIDSYYAKNDAVGIPRIVIPKGQYSVELECVIEKTPRSTDETSVRNGKAEKEKNSFSFFSISYLLVLAVFLLLLNGVYWLVRDYGGEGGGYSPEVISHPFWSVILSDDIPLLVVVGDYYIFGEQDEAGNVRRMVREFTVNSSDDLESLFTEKPELAWRYRDLDLSYIPEGAAFAMSSVLPIVYSSHKSVTLKMMSELTTQDLQSYHVIYLGYVSGLNRLSRMVFAASGLKVGENYDELVDKETGKRFVSDAGLPSENRPFIGYGFVSSVPTTLNNRLLVISGMRDAGLTQTAISLGDQNILSKIDSLLFEGDDKNIAFELLYEVRGMDRMSFSSRSVYENKIDSSLIWQVKDLE